MRKYTYLLIVVLFLTACGNHYWKYSPEISGVRSEVYIEQAPYGMVLIPKGSITLGITGDPVFPGTPTENQSASFDAFWMDATEVTNAQYRQFVYWVRDSIIRERLYDPLYGGNELFKITEDKYGEPITPRLNWNIPIPWKRATEEETVVIESVYIKNPVTGEEMLDSGQINYYYEWYDHSMAARYKKELEMLATGRVPLSINLPVITKDTAYTDINGTIINRRITRLLSGYYDFLHSRIVNIYPDESCWMTDFPGSKNDKYTRYYFNHPDYDHFPVVGVSWEMAHAFCIWRTNLYRNNGQIPPGQFMEAFRLPTEGEWEYAARTGNSRYIYPWGEDLLVGEKCCFPGNFKTGEGEYMQDGHLITSRIRSYPPNQFGLYDMAGNVAEWTISDYSEDRYGNVNDFNPETGGKSIDTGYKRKIIKGGSWKDTPLFVRSDMRSYEYQDTPRSYIGFRCVKTYVGNTGNKR